MTRPCWRASTCHWPRVGLPAARPARPRASAAGAPGAKTDPESRGWGSTTSRAPAAAALATASAAACRFLSGSATVIASWATAILVGSTMRTPFTGIGLWRQHLSRPAEEEEADGDGTRGCRGGRRRAQRAGRGGLPDPGRAVDGGVRAAWRHRRGGGERAPVRSGLYGDVAVLRGLAAAARPGPR